MIDHAPRHHGMRAPGNAAQPDPGVAGVPSCSVIWRLFGSRLLALAIVVGVLALPFMCVTDAEIDWHDVWIGALITGALFTLGKCGLGVCISHLRCGCAGGGPPRRS